MMKKIYLLCTAVVLAVMLLSGCSLGGEAGFLPTFPPLPNLTESPAPETTNPPETTAAPETTTAPETTEAPRQWTLDEVVETYRNEYIDYTDGVGNDYKAALSLMRFRIDSPDARRCNEEIALSAESRIDEALNDQQQGTSMILHDIENEAWLVNNTVTLKIHVSSMWGNNDYLIYTIDLDTGCLLSCQEVAARSGISGQELETRLASAVRRDFRSYMGIGMLGWDPDIYRGCFRETNAPENLNNAVVYANRQGDLEAAITLYTYAGAGYENRIVSLIPAEPMDVDLNTVFAVYRSKLQSLFSEAGGDGSFRLIYFDDDDVPELAFSYGGYHAAGAAIFGYDPVTGGVRTVCDQTGSYGCLTYYPRQGVVVANYMGMGYYVQSYYGLENGICVEFATHTAEMMLPSEGWGSHEYKVNGVFVDQKIFRAEVERRNGGFELSFDEDGLDDLGYWNVEEVNPDWNTIHEGQVDLDLIFDPELYQ